MLSNILSKVSSFRIWCLCLSSFSFRSSILSCLSLSNLFFLPAISDSISDSNWSSCKVKCYKTLYKMYFTYACKKKVDAKIIHYGTVFENRPSWQLSITELLADWIVVCYFPVSPFNYHILPSPLSPPPFRQISCLHIKFQEKHRYISYNNKQCIYLKLIKYYEMFIYMIITIQGVTITIKK